jgi:hypothetical protein
MFGPANPTGESAPSVSRLAPARWRVPDSAYIAVIVIGLLITLAWWAGLLWLAFRLLLYFVS